MISLMINSLCLASCLGAMPLVPAGEPPSDAQVGEEAQALLDLRPAARSRSEGFPMAQAMALFLMTGARESAAASLRGAVDHLLEAADADAAVALPKACPLANLQAFLDAELALAPSPRIIGLLYLRLYGEDADATLQAIAFEGQQCQGSRAARFRFIDPESREHPVQPNLQALAEAIRQRRPHRAAQPGPCFGPFVSVAILHR